MIMTKEICRDWDCELEREESATINFSLWAEPDVILATTIITGMILVAVIMIQYL